MIYQLLTPDLKGNLELLLIKAPPGSDSGETDFVHDGEECGVVMSGQMTYTSGTRSSSWRRGTPFTSGPALPHRWRNTSRRGVDGYLGDLPSVLLGGQGRLRFGVRQRLSQRSERGGRLIRTPRFRGRAAGTVTRPAQPHIESAPAHWRKAPAAVLPAFGKGNGRGSEES